MSAEPLQNDPAIKRCRICGDARPVTDFYINQSGNRRSECKRCLVTRSRRWNSVNRERRNESRRGLRRANPERYRREQSDWRLANPERFKLQGVRNALKRKGITLDRYVEMFYQQNGQCDACGTDNPGKGFTRFSVDHDHRCCPGDNACGVCVRALLCNNCNAALGLVNDDPARLEALILYLRRWPR